MLWFEMKKEMNLKVYSYDEAIYSITFHFEYKVILGIKHFPRNLNHNLGLKKEGL